MQIEFAALKLVLLSKGNEIFNALELAWLNCEYYFSYKRVAVVSCAIENWFNFDEVNTRLNMKEPQPNFHRVATNNARAARRPCWNQLNYK